MSNHLLIRNVSLEQKMDKCTPKSHASGSDKNTSAYNVFKSTILFIYEIFLIVSWKKLLKLILERIYFLTDKNLQ